MVEVCCQRLLTFFVCFACEQLGLYHAIPYQLSIVNWLQLSLLFVFCLLFCLLFFNNIYLFRKRIDLAIEMLDEASHAIRDMKSTLIFPIIYSFVIIAFMVSWIVIALFIYSIKEEQTNPMPSALKNVNALNNADTYKYYKFDTGMKQLLYFHAACLIYLLQVLIYFGFMVMAGAIADWYFSDWNMSRTKKIRGNDKAELSNAPLCESFWRVLRFHIGSLAFGAALIAIINIIRGILGYIQRKCDKAKNPLLMCLFSCAQFCLSVEYMYNIALSFESLINCIY